MAFIHNDIATKQRLRDALNEEGSMGFEHNDIVTTDVMNAAIAAGGGGGGDFSTCTMTVVDTYHGEFQNAYGAFIVDGDIVSSLDLTDESVFQVILYQGKQTIETATGGTVAVSGDATTDGTYIIVTGDFTLTIS